MSAEKTIREEGLEPRFSDPGQQATFEAAIDKVDAHFLDVLRLLGPLEKDPEARELLSNAVALNNGKPLEFTSFVHFGKGVAMRVEFKVEQFPYTPRNAACDKASQLLDNVRSQLEQDPEGRAVLSAVAADPSQGRELASATVDLGNRSYVDVELKVGHVPEGEELPFWLDPEEVKQGEQ